MASVCPHVSTNFEKSLSPPASGLPLEIWWLMRIAKAIRTDLYSETPNHNIV